MIPKNHEHHASRQARFGSFPMRQSVLGGARLVLIATLAGSTLLLAGCQMPHKASSDPAGERKPGEAQRLARIAEEALKKHDYEKAADYAKRSIQENPEVPGAWNNLGIALLEQQNYVDAAQALRRAADLSPTDPTPYENLGLLYYRAGYDQDALNAYSNALERDPYWLPALRGAVACAQRLNISDDATQERIRRGLMKETDPAWREVFERQRLRVDAELAERKKKAKSG